MMSMQMVVMSELVIDPSVVAAEPEIIPGLGDVIPVIVVIDSLPELVRWDLTM
jgi:hypothetical protein